MTNLEFKEVTSDEDIRDVADTAKGIWHEWFPDIISEEQIDYMVEKFQSFDALKSQISEEGYHYFAVKLDGLTAGYYGICKKADGSLFLSKLYLKKEMRGKGLASLMFKEVKRFARRNGCEMIWLTVNKGNAHAISVYKHLGMRIIREEVTDIGGGFVMDDYVFGIMV
jgi:GNAT superfamily N-acetyltransferase